ncbi:uncharacterized protein [Eleutherodactylus coqui]|uniref:uncharacterized protein n=1 Tax=Eleutherodactylus coqui TaxID=57060 RepID=UPI00346332C7
MLLHRDPLLYSLQSFSWMLEGTTHLLRTAAQSAIPHLQVYQCWHKALNASTADKRAWYRQVRRSGGRNAQNRNIRAKGCWLWLLIATQLPSQQSGNMVSEGTSVLSHMPRQARGTPHLLWHKVLAEISTCTTALNSAEQEIRKVLTNDDLKKHMDWLDDILKKHKETIEGVKRKRPPSGDQGPQSPPVRGVAARDITGHGRGARRMTTRAGMRQQTLEKT